MPSPERHPHDCSTCLYVNTRVSQNGVLEKVACPRRRKPHKPIKGLRCHSLYRGA